MNRPMDFEHWPDLSVPKIFFFDQLKWDKISGRLRHIPHVFVLGLSPYNRMSSLSELPTYPMFLKQKKKVVE